MKQTSNYLNPNIETLISQLYNEGVVTARQQADQIISEAKEKAAKLMEEANQRIAALEESSAIKIKKQKESVLTELKVAARETISTIKSELANVIATRVELDNVTVALKDVDLLKKIIYMVIENWSIESKNQFEILVNKEDESLLQDFFEKKIRKELSNELEVIIDNRIKSGFKIVNKDEGYYVSFTDEDFEKFFCSYLRNKTIELIYTNKEMANA